MSRSIKDDVLRLIDAMPDDVTWDALMYALFELQTIHRGLADSEAGRVVPVAEVRRRFLK